MLVHASFLEILGNDPAGQRGNVSTLCVLLGVTVLQFLPSLCLKALVVGRSMGVAPSAAFRVVAASHWVSGLLAVPAAWLIIATCAATALVAQGVHAPATPLREMLLSTIVLNEESFYEPVGILLILGLAGAFASTVDTVFFRWLLPDASRAAKAAAIGGNVLSHILILLAACVVIQHSQFLGRP
jgi:hypothetical protein